MGIAYAAMPTLVMDNVPTSKAGSSVGVNALMRSVGSTVAGAVIALVLTSTTIQVGATDQSVPSLDAVRMAFVIGAGAALVAVLVTLGIPRPNKRDTREAQKETVDQELTGVSA